MNEIKKVHPNTTIYQIANINITAIKSSVSGDGYTQKFDFTPVNSLEMG